MEKILSVKIKEKFKNMNVYLLYTFIFVILSLFIFYVFIKLNKSFIWYDDGVRSHFPILYDFNYELRTFLKSAQELPFFSWNLGLGLDIIGQLSANILGDPFAYISLFFKMKNLELAYNILVIVRIYFIGISYIIYCKYHKHSNLNSILGAVIYTFSSFVLYSSIRHPYFMNALIIFPMLLLGVDKLLKENKKAHLIFWVFISAFSNYYFFYMHTILLVIYAFIKYFCEYKQNGFKFFMNKFFSSVFCYIAGVLMAGIVLLPIIYAFLNSPRIVTDSFYSYDFRYYAGLFISLISASGIRWSFIGVSSIILLMIPILIANFKKYKTITIYFLITLIMLTITFISSLMNGFSAPSERWSFMFVFILSYIITLNFNKKLEYNKKELKFMCIGIALYSLIAVFWAKNYITIRVEFIISLSLAFIMLLIILRKNLLKEKELSFNNIFLTKIYEYRYTIILLSLVFINLIMRANSTYGLREGNYVSQFIDSGTINDIYANQNEEHLRFKTNIKYIQSEDNSFYRISKNPESILSLVNSASIYDYKPISLYMSISSKYLHNLSVELEDSSYRVSSPIYGFAKRTKITTLLGTKYHITDNSDVQPVPYGYELFYKKGKTKTYINKNALSLGVSYDNYILKEDYDKLSPFEKEDILLKTAVIENESDISNYDIPKLENLEDEFQDIKEIPYELTDTGKIIKSEGKIETIKTNSSIFLKPEPTYNGELYVYIENLKFTSYPFDELKKLDLGEEPTKYESDQFNIVNRNYTPSTAYTITGKLNGKEQCNQFSRDKKATYYIEKPNVLLNLGYYKENTSEIEIVFSGKGKFTYDSIKVVSVGMDNYEETINNLKENELKNIEYNDNYVKGTVDLKSDSVLQISTSYTIGWKAYVDGKEVQTINVNTAFIGIPVNAGIHEIELKYTPPYLYEGITCSIIGLLLLAIVFIYEKRKKKQTK